MALPALPSLPAGVLGGGACAAARRRAAGLGARRAACAVLSAPAPAPRLRRCARARGPAAPRAAGTLQGTEPAIGDDAEPAPPPLVPRTPADKKRLLLAAIKPPIYTVALVPVLVGFAAAFYDAGAFVPKTLGAYALCACLVIAWLNLSNDAWDAETSVDVAKAESVVRLVGSAKKVHAAAASALAAGGGGLAALVWLGRDVRVGALLTAAVACGVVYQAPPFRLSYRGVGEPLCFLAFGPLATSAFYLAALAAAGGAAAGAALPAVSPAAAAAAGVVGATTTAILFCSHFHQRDTDAAAGKRSPVVRLGTENAARVLSYAVSLTHAATAAAVGAGVLPVHAAAALAVALPQARRLMEFVEEVHGDPSRVFRAKFFAVRWHALLGLALTVAFATARLTRGAPGL